MTIVYAEGYCCHSRFGELDGFAVEPSVMYDELRALFRYCMGNSDSALLCMVCYNMLVLIVDQPALKLDRQQAGDVQSCMLTQQSVQQVV